MDYLTVCLKDDSSSDVIKVSSLGQVRSRYLTYVLIAEPHLSVLISFTRTPLICLCVDPAGIIGVSDWISSQWAVCEASCGIVTASKVIQPLIRTLNLHILPAGQKLFDLSQTLLRAFLEQYATSALVDERRTLGSSKRPFIRTSISLGEGNV